MYQTLLLTLVDWLMPNPETDTPVRWAMRIVLLVVLALAYTAIH